jgi:hypothetical protein
MQTYCGFLLFFAALSTGVALPDGTNIQIWSCSGSQRQQWSFGNDSTVRLKVDNKCLDIEDYGTQNGANVWYC